MSPSCTLQLHADGVWHNVASVALQASETDGWKARSHSGYSTEWAFQHTGRNDAHALCARWPVGLSAWQLPHWPVFLLDLLPQGFGRQEMLRRLGQTGTAGLAADWPLLLAGAGNPIGNLRVKEAADWLATQQSALRGFADEEVAQRSDASSEYLASHGLFVAGSSGIQGEWPKVLLTRAEDGLLYLDHTLADERATEHYIVKFGRGADLQLAGILRNEAPYMDIAARLGLRVHAPLMLRNRALFIPRFDRLAAQDARKLTRLAQESIASLTGLPDFDAVPSHDEVCRGLIRHCTDPQHEVLEYIRRDIANLAFGNKDNHARNTAVQRDFRGRISLTPVYDFAPMYLHPDGIARRIRWENNDAGRPDWDRVLDRVCELGKSTKRQKRAQNKPGLQREALVHGLRAMAVELARIADDGQPFGVDADVAAHLQPGLLAHADALAALR